MIQKKISLAELKEKYTIQKGLGSSKLFVLNEIGELVGEIQETIQELSDTEQAHIKLYD